jgi:hypothetical protein
MRYLFTLYHPKKRSITHLPLENGPDTIPTMYYLLSQESPLRFSDKWMHWLWIGRNQGIARFPALLKGVESEMNSYHIRQYLGNLMRQLVKEFENGDQNLDKFHRLLDHEKEQMYRIAPQLMLHATAVYDQKYSPKGLETSLRKLSGTSFCDHQALRKVFIQSKKIDFGQWLEFLTFPTKTSPPMIQMDLLKKLNRILLSLDQKNSIFRDMLEDHYPERFQLKLSLRRDEKFLHPYEGVRMEINSSILSRFQVLAETWT